MDISQLSSIYRKSPNVKAVRHLISDTATQNIAMKGLCASAAAMVFASAAADTDNVIMYILNDADEAGYFFHDIIQTIGEENVHFFPSSYKRAIKYGQRDAANEVLRTETLSALHLYVQNKTKKLKTQPLHIVTYPDAIAELVVSTHTFNDNTITLKLGETHDTTQLINTLRENGFKEVDYVYEPGQFAHRGSIIDVYSYSCETPFRIDFFGDEIDSIRTFEVETQLSSGKKDTIDILSELNSTDVEKVPVLNFMPQDAIVAFKDLQFIYDRISTIYDEGFSAQAIKVRLETATEMQQDEILKEYKREKHIISKADFNKAFSGFRTISFGHRTFFETKAAITFNTTAQPLFHKNFDIAAEQFNAYLSKGYRIFILADSPKQQERLKEILKLPFTPINKTLHEGYIDNDLELCCFTDHQIFSRFHKYNLRSYKVRSGKVALTLKDIMQFKVGDYVVHIDHGVGKFCGLVRMPNGNSYQEMIKLQYQHGDTIYVSIHTLYKVSKYKSQDNGEPPRLSNLGTGQWERLKERTKTRIKDIARDLIRLYSKRCREKGYAYSKDSFMQNELEASFQYEDTPDQLSATNDVKADMEKDKPMDRLVCGDVGFGKTEIAIRAAFKAAADSKQVAVMVPTTVLAYQHYQTFKKRLANFPVSVDYLSRARSAKQTTELLKKIQEGKTDIVIGTHKLIGKNVKFKDLGLLIIDEEQKFGVSTKEKLRQMKTNIDTLTMSATPIPRTLQFSLVGARDMSVIRTPPPNRYPVTTEIHTFDPDFMAEAVNFEMSRNGQVYIVNNRINDLPHIAKTIQQRIPDARIAIGHGQMKPAELEDIILGFAEYEYDVLVSTTIIESGIDIPNANTIIINGAHKFGLSDLHQMRGRVGRGNKKAFCYLIAPPLAALSTEARRRLEALENFSDLGSGINIAMQDLDIRGAGNLLGGEQSGFISDLGYETYKKILNQAMTELRNEEQIEDSTDNKAQKSRTNRYMKHNAINPADYVDDCTIESDLEMYFPEQFVPGASERILLYRELDHIEDEKSLEEYKKRLTDRFGDIPKEGTELMSVVMLRKCGKTLGCEKIVLKQNAMQLHLLRNLQSPYYRSATFDHLVNYATINPKRCQFKEIGNSPRIVIANIPSATEALTLLQNIVSTIN